MNPIVTIFLPVSRSEYLPKIFTALEHLECDRTRTNIIVSVDGDVALFVETRNYVELSKFEQKFCIQFESKIKMKQFDVYSRRIRIANINNFIKQYIEKCDYIFGLEDDTIFPSNSLKCLISDYIIYPYAGFIQGVELGRWGIPYVGAWKLDDIYEPKHITSIIQTKGLSTPFKDQLEEIDAGGLYCYLTKYENFINHNHETFENNNFGPDINYGVNLRREGLNNYIDWSILNVHKTKEKDISLFNTTPRIIEFNKLDNDRWRQNIKI